MAKVSNLIHFSFRQIILMNDYYWPKQRKNHTGKNASNKDHMNGIKKVRSHAKHARDASEALKIGQYLQYGNYISHVCDDHEFKNEFLFFL